MYPSALARDSFFDASETSMKVVSHPLPYLDSRRRCNESSSYFLYEVTLEVTFFRPHDPNLNISKSIIVRKIRVHCMTHKVIQLRALQLANSTAFAPQFLSLANY